jgi:hypothetical protein
MRWIVVLALITGTGCLPPQGGQQSTVDNQTAARINQLEQRVTALEQYLRQLYDVLAKNGSLRAPENAGAAPTQPAPPAPTTPTPPSH